MLDGTRWQHNLWERVALWGCRHALFSFCATRHHCHPMVALVGFRGRGCADVVQPNCCHPFLLEALLFQWPSIRRCASRTMVEPKPLESNKSHALLPLLTPPTAGAFGFSVDPDTAFGPGSC